jgi:hypothetical protein
MMITALSLSLDGLGIGTPITSFAPRFRLDGLGVDYQSGPVTLSGGLLALRGQDGSVSEYDGAVTLAAESFELAALASYSTGSEASLFAFAFLDPPLGGPPYLFVTGVAAGFGYNRDLLIPPIARTRAERAGRPAQGRVRGKERQWKVKGDASDR